MKQITLSIQQVKRWAYPQPWMVGGYSSTQDVFYLREGERQVALPAGGWSLSAVDLVRLTWTGDPDTDCMYDVILNQCRLYSSRWAPKLMETVTESFFADDSLYVINYRLLRVAEE